MEETNIASTESVVETTETAPETSEDVWAEDYNTDQDAPVDETTEETSEKPSTDPVELSMDDLYSQSLDDDKEMEPVLVKYKGKVHEVKSQKEMRDLMERGIGSTAKFQEMAEDRKFLQYLEDNGVDKTKIDAFIASQGQVPVESDNTVSQVEEVAQGIVASSYADDFRETAKELPDDIRTRMQQDPGLMQGFAGDVESGLAQKIMPKVKRLMDINGLDFFQAYATAGQDIQERTKQSEASRETLASQPSPNVRSQESTSVWDMPLKDFDRFMDRM